MRLFAFCVLVALACTTASDDESFQEEFLASFRLDSKVPATEVTQEAALSQAKYWRCPSSHPYAYSGGVNCCTLKVGSIQAESCPGKRVSCPSGQSRTQADMCANARSAPAPALAPAPAPALAGQTRARKVTGLWPISKSCTWCNQGKWHYNIATQQACQQKAIAAKARHYTYKKNKSCRIDANSQGCKSHGKGYTRCDGNVHTQPGYGVAPAPAPALAPAPAPAPAPSSAGWRCPSSHPYAYSGGVNCCTLKVGSIQAESCPGKRVSCPSGQSRTQADMCANARSAPAPALAPAPAPALAPAPAPALAPAPAPAPAKPKVKGTSPYAGTYEVYYRGHKRKTGMSIDCNGKVTQKNIFTDRLHFNGVKAKCSSSPKATMYILNTHGRGKYECVHPRGTSIKGNHYIGPNKFWGKVEYRLKKKEVCGVTKRAEACKIAYGQNYRGPPGNEDVKRVDKVKTLAKCSALCSTNAACTYFVYQKKFLRCWLKKNYTHKQPDSTCESGRKCILKTKPHSPVKGAAAVQSGLVPSVPASTIKKDVKALTKKFFSKKAALKRKNDTRRTVARLEGGIDDEEDAPLTHLKKNSRGKNRIYGKASNNKPKHMKNGQVRSPGYTPQDAYVGPGGHYYIGSGRRRIGTGFGRRRRSIVVSSAKKKAAAKKKTAAKNAVKTAAKSELTQKAKKKGGKAVKACQKARDFTLHRTGGQCYFDKKRRDCAQCRKGGCQCWEKSTRGHHACVKCGKGAHCQCPSTAASKQAKAKKAAKAKAKKAAKALATSELKAKNWLAKAPAPAPALAPAPAPALAPAPAPAAKVTHNKKEAKKLSKKYKAKAAEVRKKFKKAQAAAKAKRAAAAKAAAAANIKENAKKVAQGKKIAALKKKLAAAKKKKEKYQKKKEAAAKKKQRAKKEAADKKAKAAKEQQAKKAKALAKAEAIRAKKERAHKNRVVRKCTNHDTWANCTAHPIAWYTNCKGAGTSQVTWRRCGFMNAGGQYLCRRTTCRMVKVRV